MAERRCFILPQTKAQEKWRMKLGAKSCILKANGKHNPMPDFTQKDNSIKPEPVQPELTDSQLLTKIEGHLHSIRNILQFCLIVLIIGVILQNCGLLSR
jgi:hypothetical protein